LKRRWTWLIALLLAAVPAATPHAEDDPAPSRAVRALAYLDSSVPSLQRRAEVVIRNGAEQEFERLQAELDTLPPRARVHLLRILVETRHAGVAAMCVEHLSNPASTRTERLIASTGLKGTSPQDAAAEAMTRLDAAEAAEAGTFAWVQLMGVLGNVPLARAQAAAEGILRGAEPESLNAFLAEDAALRSILASEFAQPAWERYRQRNPGTVNLPLRELQAKLADLALPTAMERARAEADLVSTIGSDERLLLALARSPLPERAHFALRRLARNPVREHELPALLIALDLMETAPRTAALLALDVAIAGNPPELEALDKLRPMLSMRGAARLDSIVQDLHRAGDLTALRESYAMLHARLKPMLIRRGALAPEVRRLQIELARVEARLSALEQHWAEGWIREFHSDILSSHGA
jgi:hypothetical protein